MEQFKARSTYDRGSLVEISSSTGENASDPLQLSNSLRQLGPSKNVALLTMQLCERCIEC